MKINTYFFVILIIVSFNLLGQDDKAYSIVDKALEAKNKTRKITYQMKIKDGDSEKKRLFSLKNKKKEIFDYTFIRFFKPASIRGTSFLIKKEDKTEHQWIYLSAFKIIRKLASSEKNNSFMGSDFTNSDISGIKIKDFNYKILKRE